jgi:hypothetical protein
MKLKMRKTLSGVAEVKNVGQIYEFAEAEAKRLIDAGIAELAKAVSATKSKRDDAKND